MCKKLDSFNGGAYDISKTPVFRSCKRITPQIRFLRLSLAMGLFKAFNHEGHQGHEVYRLFGLGFPAFSIFDSLPIGCWCYIFATNSANFLEKIGKHSGLFVKFVAGFLPTPNREAIPQMNTDKHRFGLMKSANVFMKAKRAF